MTAPDDDSTRVIPATGAFAAPQPPAPAPADEDDATRVLGPSSTWHDTTSADDDATCVRPQAFSTQGAGAPPSSPSTRSGAADNTAASKTLSGLPSTRNGEAASASDADGVVRQVGRYRILSRLGRGGMASVYRAHDPQIERDIAIKFLHASLAEDEECHARFLREARAAGALSHPNIVIVHDVGEIEGRPYMAMELIEGTSLADLLEKHKQAPIRDTVVVGLQLARALDYAHARGVVHRDIKPGNIMVLKGSRTVKVADFGIAHMDDGGNQRTQVGAVLGTPQYMSPEQTRGDPLDGRSDLFSAGIVLYQMVTGERPFRGESLVAVATKIANDPPAPMAPLRPDLPPSLRRIIERCLAKQPSQRFQNGEELAAALTKVLAEIDDAAKEKSKRRIVPLRIKWALAMAAIVAVVMGSTAAFVSYRQYQALMNQAMDYGVSMARFLARQHAASALGEDWEVVDIAVQEMMKTGSFERIVVVDPAGTIKASSQAGTLGQPYKATVGETLGQQGGATAVRYKAKDESVLGFEAPIMFQDKLVGRIALGIPEKPLTQVANLSISLMVVLALITTLAVALAMYFLADWFAKPIRLVSEALDEIAKGNLTHRIAETRSDEFGDLYTSFDAMADALQKRSAPSTEGATAVGLSLTTTPGTRASAAAAANPPTDRPGA